MTEIGSNLNKFNYSDIKSDRLKDIDTPPAANIPDSFIVKPSIKYDSSVLFESKAGKEPVKNNFNFLDDEFSQSGPVNISVADDSSLDISLPVLFNNNENHFRLEVDHLNRKVKLKIDNEFKDSLVSPVKGYLQDSTINPLKNVWDGNPVDASFYKAAAKTLAIIALADSKAVGKLIGDQDFNPSIAKYKMGNFDLRLGMGIHYDGDKKGLLSGDSNLSFSTLNAGFKSREFQLSDGKSFNVYGKVAVGDKDRYEIGSDYSFSKNVVVNTRISRKDDETRFLLSTSFPLK